MRLALLELARGGIEPGAEQPPDAWDAMADAYQAAGDPAKAGRAATRAADRAAAPGQADAAAAARLRAGAFFFQGGKFSEADAALSRVADDPAAGSCVPGPGCSAPWPEAAPWPWACPAPRPRPMPRPSSARSASFPANRPPTRPAGCSASWPGAAADRDRAVTLWSAISPAAARWLDARLAIAAVIATISIACSSTPTSATSSAVVRAGRQFLTESLSQPAPKTPRPQLLLARRGSTCAPTTSRPEVARDICDRVLRIPVTPAFTIVPGSSA